MKTTTDPVQFQVTILYPDGYRATLTHKGRFRWSRRTAQKHAREFQAKHGQQNKTELVEV